MARTASEMWQEPGWQKVILEEPEVWGVQTLYTDAVLLRVVARTVPLRQWEVQRELTERLKNSLDATGAPTGPGSCPAPSPTAAGHGAGAHADAAARRPALAAPPSPTTTRRCWPTCPRRGSRPARAGAPSGPAAPGHVTWSTPWTTRPK